MTRQDEWDKVMALINQLAPALVSEFLVAVSDLATGDWLPDVAEALERGDIDAVVARIFPADRVAELAPKFGLAMRTVHEALGTEFVSGMRPLQPPIGPPVEFRFDVLDKRVVDTIRSQTNTLAAAFRETTTKGIKQYVLDGVKRGVNPKEVAETMLRDKVVGLSARGAQAVANYRASLVGTDRRAVLARALQRESRDKRYDARVQRAIATQNRLPKEQIDKMVARFREKLLRHELQTIALSEALQANETVRQQSWMDAITRGYLDPRKYVKKWYVAKDERTCPICTGIAAMNKNGVPVDGFFKVPNGEPIRGPLAHPRCRCITLITAKA